MAARNDSKRQDFASRAEKELADQWTTVLRKHKQARGEVIGEGGDSETEARKKLYFVATDFARNARPLLADKQSVQTSRDWWEGVEVGSWDIGQGRTVSLISVRDWFETEFPRTASWTEEQQTKLRGTREVTRRVEVMPPMDTTMRAVSIVHRGLHDIGMGPDPSNDIEEHEFKYEDLAPAAGGHDT